MKFNKPDAYFITPVKDDVASHSGGLQAAMSQPNAEGNRASAAKDNTQHAYTSRAVVTAISHHNYPVCHAVFTATTNEMAVSTRMCMCHSLACELPLREPRCSEHSESLTARPPPPPQPYGADMHILVLRCFPIRHIYGYLISHAVSTAGT